MESSSSSNWRNRKPNQNWRRGQRPEARSSASYSNFETHGAEASQWRDQSSSNKVKFKSRDQTNAGSTSRGHGTNINQRGSENYRGQKGNRGDNRGGPSQPPRPIGYGLLKEMATNTPSDVLIFCGGEQFHSLLEDGSLDKKKDWVDLILIIINNALSCEIHHHFKQQLVSFLLENEGNFLSKICVARFTTELISFTGMKIDSLTESLDNYLKVFHHLCALDPLASKTLVAGISTVKLLLQGKSNENDHLKHVTALYVEALEEMEKKEKEEKELALRKAKLAKTGRVLTNEKPETSFREMSVYPTEEDLEEDVELRKNKIDEPYDDIEDYLETHFRLLREDFVSTLRQGIKEYKENPILKGPNRLRSGNVKVYDDLTVLSPNLGKNGLTYFVSMNKNSHMFKKTDWQSTKRLIFGSLLCISVDHFEQNKMFATIADRDVKTMSTTGVFEIQFLPESQKKYDLLANQTGPFMAVESSAYFESYIHVLAGMKALTEDTFPLSRYIVNIDTDLVFPEYMRRVETNYRFITKDDSVTRPVQVGISGSTRWPPAETLGFNQSQYDAFKMALTKEFAIIQGPPGTGKTYVGLKIVETLLYNLYHVPCQEAPKSARKHSGGNLLEKIACCPPRSLNQILVVCYTNHALDQFLEGLLSFCPIEDMIRVGSRSKNKTLEPCNIKNQRAKSRVLRRAFADAHSQREVYLNKMSYEKIKGQIENCQLRILDHNTGGFFLHFEQFHQHLEALADKLEQQGTPRENAMSVFLECASTVYNPDHDVEREDEFEEFDSIDEFNPASEYIDMEGEAERETHNRMIDDEDEKTAKYFKKMKPNFMRRAENDSLDSTKGSQANGAWETVEYKRTKMKLELKIKEQLASTDIMTRSEAEELLRRAQCGIDITQISIKQRWRLYRFLLVQYQNLIGMKISEMQDKYVQIVNLQSDLRNQQDIDTLKRAKVIGMTTTGAARMQSVLQQVGPEIVVVEEAAEVLEAHIITALSQHCKHLILIGDHQQLKPNPNVYELAKEYHLDMSLFERMVKNGVPLKTLDTQHRMRPEVSKFMKHIYEKLSDHESVLNRDSVEGMKSPVYFFNHSMKETADEMTMSRSNTFEADMVVGLTRYLLSQESYTAKDITIITMYTGQLLLIKNKMPRREFEGINITSVDNFQGEENKILIISLVRSNDKDTLGFVKIENRVCVCLSRAQYGMYVFGNFDMLSRGSELWKNVANEAKEAKEFGSRLLLGCHMHQNTTEIQTPEDFRKKSPTGGCMLPCNKKLNCGHVCKMLCHNKDVEHKEYKCTKKCTKMLQPCNHPCPNMCHQKCQQCLVQTLTQLSCGHPQLVHCYQTHTEKERAKIQCRQPCPKILDCGHQCSKLCSQSCTKECVAKVDQLCSRCGEIKGVPCFMTQERLEYKSDAQKYSYQCDTRCQHTLPCGHQCPGSCYSCNLYGHRSCDKQCDKQLDCGHMCAHACTRCSIIDEVTQAYTHAQDCLKQCNKLLACGHTCRRMCRDCKIDGKCGTECEQRCLLRCSHCLRCDGTCGAPCVFYTTNKHQDRKCKWSCKHRKCERYCGQPCSFVPCDNPCDQHIDCKMCKQRYDCQGMCGEPCPLMCFKCDQPKERDNIRIQVSTQLADDISFLTKWILLADCMHLVPVDYMDNVVYRSPLAAITPCCPYRECGRPVLNTRRYAARTRPSNIGHSLKYHGPKNVKQKNNSKKQVPIDVVFADPSTQYQQRRKNIPMRSLTDTPNAPPLPSWLAPASQTDRELEEIQLKLKEAKIQNEIRQDFTLRNPDNEVSSFAEDSRVDWADT